MNELTLEEQEFKQLLRAFMGGHTHANANYVEQVISDVWSKDFTSSYPAVMVLEKFPMSKAHLITEPMTKEVFSQLLETRACLFDVTFYDIYHKLKFEHPISRSKCWECEGEVTDNGRIVFADKISITVTEQDYFTYSKFYGWSKCEISNFRWYYKQYLPHEFVKAILGLYKQKTVLKGIIKEEINYMISKNMLNASYGMSVTNPVRDTIEYEDDVYKSTKPCISDALDIYNKDVKRFLFYPWGVWITAYARRNLFTAIEAIGKDFVYSDTDSIKYINEFDHRQYFEEYNKQIDEKIKKAAEYHNLEISMFSPLTQDGKVKTIGVWDDDGHYDKFKTLGAKRYMYLEDGEYHITLAGANKKSTAKYLSMFNKPFDHFNRNLCIPKEYSGRLTITYIDDETSGVVVDYKGKPYHYHELSSIHMEPSEYNLTMSDEFINYLKGVREIE